MCFLGQKEGHYHVNIVQLPKDLLYKEIPSTSYVNNEQIIEGEQVFVTWDYKGANVKYLPCAFERIYVLDVINMLKDLLYEDIPKEYRMIHM
jgi:hypothetical protein